jgi:adenylate cyclase
MPSLIPGYEYDVFISYRQKDNRQDGWVTQFVKALRHELDATFKEDISIYFDSNPHDGLLETHDVGDSLKGKLKCLVFIPIVSQTYCDPKSFAWEQEFLVFKKLAAEDSHGLKIRLPGSNVANRILPVRIHELDSDDRQMLEDELGGVLRSVDFIFKSSGVNRPLTPKDDEVRSAGQILYRDQVNKVANSIKELLTGMRKAGGELARPQRIKPEIEEHQPKTGFWQELKRRNVFRVASVYAVAGWLIIQIGSSIFGPLHIPEWTLTFLIVVILLGFPIAIILAWAFEVSPDGTIVSAKEGDLRTIPQPKKKPVTTIALVILVVTIISQFVYFRFFNNRGSVETSNDKSVVVMPFMNMTGEKEQEYFSEGMTIEIVNHLSKISAIHVVKGSRLSLKEILKELGVATVLEGSVRKSGDQVRITAQLIDARNENVLWSQDFDYRMKEIFALQSDVAVQIARVLKAKLTEEEKGALNKTYTTNVQAYKFYLRGRFFWDKRSKVSYDSAEANFKRAIEIDPDYALAYVGLADCYTFNQKGLTQVEGIDIANAYVRRALLLDSNLCEAVTTEGFIRANFEYDWKGARPILEKAIRLNPNYPIAHVYYGNVFLLSGQDKTRGIQEIKKALRLDPLSSSINMVLGRSYYDAREYDSAVNQLKRALRLDSKNYYSRLYMGLTLLQKKDYAGAIEMASKLPEIMGGEGKSKKLVLSSMYAIAGDKGKATRELAAWFNSDHKPFSPYWLARVYVALGDYDKALDELERDLKLRAIQMTHVSLDPDFDPIRNEPRFKEILKNMNLD